MNKIKEFLNKLGIEKKGIENKNKYIIKLDNSDEFAKIYSKFENSELIELEDNLVIMDSHISGLIYTSDKYEVRLLSNFDDDSYHIVILPLAKDTTQEEQEK